MRGRKLIGMLCGLTLMSLYGCQTSPEPCDCGAAEAETMQYSKKYFHTLAEVGVLRQDLKACNERK